MSSTGSQGRPPSARATSVVRHGKIWLLPSILSALVTLLLSLVYMGGIVNPEGHLRGLPVALVDTDQGPPLPGQGVPLGEQLSRTLIASTPGGTIQWRQLSQAQMQDQLASGKIYGAFVIPSDFTRSVAALTTPRADVHPTLTILTNPGLGSLGSSLASQATQKAAHQASLTIGRQLTARAAT